MKPRITLVHNHRSRFVELDLEIFSRFADVTELGLTNRRPECLRTFRAVAGCDLVVCWFASWHSFLPSLLGRALGKPVVVISGGYDVADVPGIGYGHQRGGLRKWVSRKVLNSATVVAAFSKYSADEVVRNADIHHSNVIVVYLGVPDSQIWARPSHKVRDVLTVGNVSRSNLERKGLRIFAQASRLVPDIRFIVAGKTLDGSEVELRSTGAENLLVTGWLPRRDLDALMARCSVYAQVSRHEGFGLAVAEAMLARCIPVFSGVGSLPEVIGDCGVQIGEHSPEAVAAGVSTALQMGQEEQERCRQRILDHFPLGSREKAFRELVFGLLGDRRRDLGSPEAGKVGS